MRIAVVALLSLFLLACESDTNDSQRSAAIQSRDQTFARAERQYPVPQTLNFPLREALVKFTERQDLIEHPWYVYVMGDNGNVIGYYVGQTGPINACNFLSSTENVETKYEGTIVLTAPSLDGIYYGGGGSEGSCDAWFFFDYATDAMIVIRGLNYFIADQPLLIEAEPINVGVAP